MDRIDKLLIVFLFLLTGAVLFFLMTAICCTTSFSHDANYVFPDLMKKVQSRGYGMEIEQRAEFGPAGAILIPEDVIGETPVSRENFRFECEASLCGSNTPLTLSSDGKHLTVNTKIVAAIAVCAVQESQEPFTTKYYAIITPTEKAGRIADKDSPFSCKNI